jgi:hypothetical protein
MRNLIKSDERHPEWHPGDDDLLLYLDGELAPRIHGRIDKHLKVCWACRVKAEKLESAIAAFMDYRGRAAAEWGEPASVDAFCMRLNSVARQHRPGHSLRQIALKIWQPAYDSRVRVLALSAAGIVAVALIVLAWRNLAPVPVSARELLADASVAETASANDAALVLHRSLTWETRKSGEAKPIERRRIEIWHAGRSGVTARRLYDESGNLLAAEWRQRDGSAELYLPHAHPWLEPQAEPPQMLLNHPQDLWRLDLSAASFVQLAGDASRAEVSRQGADYHLSIGPAHPADPLLKAELTIRKNGLRATGIDLRLAGPVAPASASEPAQPAIYEYSIAEDTYEQEPPANAQANAFEPDAVLLPAADGQAPVATPDMQMETMWLLDQIGATLGGEIAVNLSTDQRLHVQGIVKNDARKQEILAALSPVRGNPAVKIQILTTAQASRRAVTTARSVAGTVPGVASGNSSLPAQADIGEFLASQPSPLPQTERRERVTQLSAEISTDSSNAARHAWVLKHLVEMAGPGDAQALSMDARRQYLAMVVRHAREVEQSTRRVQLQLEPVFFSELPPPGPNSALQAEPSPTPTIDRLLNTVLRNDKSVQAAFGISAGVEATVSIRSQEFHESLLETVQLACSIEKQAGGKCESLPPETKTNP